MKPFVSCAIIYDEKAGAVLLQHRTADALVNPNKWGFFGGHGEAGETPGQTLIREIFEEIGVMIGEKDFRPLFDYQHKENGVHRHVYLILTFTQHTPIILSEGQGYAWVPVKEFFDRDLTAASRSDLERFFLGRLRF